MAATGCGLDNKRYMGIPIMNVVSFYLCTWQTYHTRSLVLGHINGPTEGIILSCVIFCISGYYGTPTIATSLLCNPL